MLKSALKEAKREESVKISEMTQEYEEKLEAAHAQMRQMQMNLSQNMVCTSKNLSFGAQEDHCNTSTPTIRTHCGPGLTSETQRKEFVMKSQANSSVVSRPSSGG